eukprot:gene13059-3835_t
MSFRKKARPVIAVSAVARARISKSSVIEQPDKEKDDTSLQEDVAIPGPCDLSSNQPNVDNNAVEANIPQNVNDESISENDTSSSWSSTPIASGRRFKRAKPMPNFVSTKRPCQPSKLTKSENSPSKIDELQSTSFLEAITHNESQGTQGSTCKKKDGNYLHNTDSKIELECKGIEDQGFCSSTLVPDTQSEIKIRNLEEPCPNLSQLEVGATDSSLDCSNVDENPMGFLVTESKISYGSSYFENKVTEESKQDSCTVPFKEDKSCEDNINNKISKGTESRNLSQLSRFKRQKPKPIIGGQRLKVTKDVDKQKKDTNSESNKITETFATANDKNIPDESFKTVESSCRIKEEEGKSENIVNVEEKLILVNDCKMESDSSDQLVTLKETPKNEFLNDTVKQLENMESSILNGNESPKVDSGGSSVKGSRVCKRVKFKPNITPKDLRVKSKRENNDKEDIANNSTMENSSTDDSKRENEQRHPEPTNPTESQSVERTGGKHVRFNQDIVNENVSKSFDGTDEKLLNAVEKDIINTAGELSQESRYPGPHSDAEDGSQSEGEGIHHHGKRKFTPCLGPRVRQRRRLSSVNLSEDESHAAAKISSNFANASDKNEEEQTDESEKKKQKRKRIVIREPKEKMTMFDYIYYNPKASEQEQAEKESENKQKKRQYKETSRHEESEIVVGSINEDSVTSNNDSLVINDDDDDTTGPADDSIIAPQVKIGEDGQIVIDEESEIVYTDSFNPYQRRQEPIKKKRWPVEAFILYMSNVDTLSGLFNPQKKFKTEEKYNGDLIDRALKNMLPLDQALLEELSPAIADKQQTQTELSNSTEQTNIRKQNAKRKTREKPAKGRSCSVNSLLQENEIIDNEIMTMEVAENVTI